MSAQHRPGRGCPECAWGKVAGCWRCGSRLEPGALRGFLGNGSWLIAVHTKKCARDRRRVTSGERARSLVPNHNEQFVNAMRDRAAIAKATRGAA